MVEQTSSDRPISWVGRVLWIVLIGYAVFLVVTAFTGMMEPLIQRSLFLGFGLGSIFLITAVTQLQEGKGRGLFWLNIGLSLLGYAVCLHIAFSNSRISLFMVDLTSLDLIFGAIAIALVLEGGRRTIGWFLPLLAIIGLAYYYFGHNAISGPWQPPRVSFLTMVETYYASTETLFGYMTDMGTRVIAIFIVLGALLLSTGATEIFIKLATLIAGRSHGGQAKVCTASSALFGTVTGSAVANVMAMGPVTIPAMKRAGYKTSYAAAIEAVASAGGQIMPPVMGAGAFIMAEMLGIPYSQIAAAALLPAILYFMTLWFSVGFRARRMDIRPLERHELPAWRELVEPYTALPMYLPIGTLIALLVLDFTPTLAGAAAVAMLLSSLLFLRTLKCLNEEGVAGLLPVYQELGGQILDGLFKAGRAIAMIAVLLACAAIVVKVLTATGAGVKVSSVILSMSGANLVLVLILTAILSILLGMDVPTTASYILASAIAAPIIINLGIPDLNAHLFVFYYAILSAITPPVCASVFAAASVANVNFWRVSGHAIVLAIALYVIPFLFIYRPGILMEGSLMDILYDFGIAAVAVMSIAAASSGYLFSRLGWIMRVPLYGVAALLFYAAPWSDLAGALLLCTLAAISYWQGRRQTVQAAG